MSDFNFELSDEQRERIRQMVDALHFDGDKAVHDLELLKRGLLSNLEGCPNCRWMLPDEVDGTRTCTHCGWGYALSKQGGNP